MKNVFYILAVCLGLGIYSCSNNSSEKVATVEEITDIVTEKNAIIEETLSEAGELISEADSLIAETEPIAENVAEKIKEEKAETPAKPKPSFSKNEEKLKANTASKPKPSSSNSATTKPSNPVKDEVIPPPPTPKTTTTTVPLPKPVEVVEEVKEVVEDIIEEPAPSVNHSPWDALLRKNVSSSGVVNYSGFKSDKSKLEAYLSHLEEYSPKSDWSKNKKLAYWINLYNAWTVKTIVDKYPVGSITDIDGGKTWDVKRVKSGSDTYSLSHVENKIIRPRFNDGRIHFAVNCAAKSCPPLLNRAWTASNLQSNLEKMTKAFVNNSTHNTISANKIKISKIFEWYAVDFGDLIPYLNKYSNVKINTDAKVEYHEYNWDLNGK